MTKNTLKSIVLISSLIALTACSTVNRIANPFPPITTKSQGHFKVGSQYKVDGKWYQPRETYNFTQTGIASWYGPNFHGKLTANGEVYDQNALTAAHKTLQIPSIVRVTNLENGRSLIVRVNDRGPFSRGRIIDMSKRGAELLKFKNQGTAKVKVQVLEKESRAVAEAAKQGIDVSGIEIALNEGGPLPGYMNDIDNNQNNSTPTPLTRTASLSPTSIIEPVQTQTLNAPVQTIQEAPLGLGNIFVQTGSFSSLPNAQAEAARLSALGNARVYPADINGQTFYRVRLGPVKEVVNADKLLNSAVSAGQNNAIIVVD